MQMFPSAVEDEYDLKAYDEAMATYKNDPVTYSLDEAERELGFKDEI